MELFPININNSFLGNKSPLNNAIVQLFIKSICEDGYYGDTELRECMACNSACKTCKGPDIDDCTAC